MSFNTSRFLQLIKRDAIIYRRPILIAMACIPVIAIMIFYIQELTEESAFSHPFFLSWYNIFLFVGGIAFTSMVMWEFRTVAGRTQYLTLPASNLEKWLSRFLYTLVVYPLYIFILFYIIGSFGDVYGDKTSLGIFMFVSLKLYLVLHAFMYLAAIWFNNYSAPKVFFYGLAVFFICVIIISIFFRLIFFDAFDGFLMINQDIKIEPNEAFQSKVENVYMPILQSLFWWGLPIFLWFVSYFKMKEKEA